MKIKGNRNNRDTKVINFQQPTPSPTNSQSYSNLELNKFVKNIIHSFDEDCKLLAFFIQIFFKIL